MSDLAVAARIGLGLSAGDLLDVRKTVDNEIAQLQNTIRSQIVAQIKPQLDNLATTVVNNARDYVHQQAAMAGETGAQAARSAVVKYSIIAAGVGIVGGGLLGWQLAKRLR
jgi:hypothetical protein